LPTFVRDSRRLHALRSDAHLPGALVPIPGAKHFGTLDAISRPDGVLTQAALQMAVGLAAVQQKASIAAVA
jgi:hypothetical protein